METRRRLRCVLALVFASLAMHCEAGADPSLAGAELLRQAAMVDLHNDRSFFLTARGVKWAECRGVSFCAGRIRSGQYFFAVFRPPGPLRAGPPWGLSTSAASRWNDQSYFAYVELAAADLHSISDLPVRDSLDLLGAQENAIFLALEGAFLLDRGQRPTREELSVMLDALRNNGFRMVGLTWSNANRFAGVAGDNEGLSSDGRWLVGELIRRGLVVDLSHASDQSVRDLYALTGGRYPLVFSHSSARAVCNHPRNLSDELITLTARSGGLVAVNFHAPYVNCRSEAQRDEVIAHLQHLRRVGGAGIVGFGGDLDGLIRVPRGLERPDDARELLVTLLDHGWTETEALGALSGNARRVLMRAAAFRLD